MAQGCLILWAVERYLFCCTKATLSLKNKYVMWSYSPPKDGVSFDMTDTCIAIFLQIARDDLPQNIYFPCCWHILMLYDWFNMPFSPCSVHPEHLPVPFLWCCFFTVELGGKYFTVSSDANLKWIVQPIFRAPCTYAWKVLLSPVLLHITFSFSLHVAKPWCLKSSFMVSTSK